MTYNNQYPPYPNMYGQVSQQPYYQQVPQPQMQTPYGLLGRYTSNPEEIRAYDLPQNGTPAYFPMNDYSAIYAKYLDPSNNIQTVKYIPSEQPNVNSAATLDAVLNRLDSIEKQLNTLAQTAKPKRVYRDGKNGGHNESDQHVIQ